MSWLFAESQCMLPSFLWIFTVVENPLYFKGPLTNPWLLPNNLSKKERENNPMISLRCMESTSATSFCVLKAKNNEWISCSSQFYDYYVSSSINIFGDLIPHFEGTSQNPIWEWKEKSSHWLKVYKTFMTQFQGWSGIKEQLWVLCSSKKRWRFH